MSSNKDYATGNSLDYSYYQNYYKLISIDLSRQKNTNIPQQITFIEKLEEYNGERIFFITEKREKLF